MVGSGVYWDIVEGIVKGINIPNNVELCANIWITQRQTVDFDDFLSETTPAANTLKLSIL